MCARTAEKTKEYVGRLAKEAGLENLTAEERRKFDRKRKGKKCSNDDWQSPSDPDARITKIKNGDTPLAYKAEHAVDLETTTVVAAQTYHATEGDAETLTATLTVAQENLKDGGSEQTVEEAVADRGYHKAETLDDCGDAEIRTYIPERKGRRRTWTNKRRDCRKRCMRTGGGAKARGVNGCSGNAANRWNAASPTCARRAGHGAVGSAGSRR